jgi:protein subunit release factor A
MADEAVTKDQCSIENINFCCLCESSTLNSDNQELKPICVNCKKIENLKSDLDEFNKLITITTRQVVEEVILAEIKAVRTKIENLKAIIGRLVKQVGLK